MDFDTNISVRNIRSIQMNIHSRLKFFGSQISRDQITPALLLCDDISNILNVEDEDCFTVIQNIYRKMNIVSELFFDISVLYAQLVHLEFRNIVLELFSLDKCRAIAKIMNHKKRISVQWEKYFKEEAQSKIKVFLELQGIRKKIESRDLITGKFNENNIKDSEIAVSVFDCYEANLTEIRQDHSNNVIHLEEFKSQIPLLETVDFNSTIKSNQTLFQKNTTENSQFTNQNGSKFLPNIMNPEGGDKDERSSQNLEKNEKSNDSKKSFESSWNLSDLHLSSNEEPPIKKRRFTVIDEKIFIPYYAERALKLNKKIKIERVQVYKGPPTILKSISSHYMMTHASSRKGILQDNRNPKLTNLYNRHLLTGKDIKYHRMVVNDSFSRSVEKIRENNFTQFEKDNFETEELFGRSEMRSACRSNDILMGVLKQPVQLKDLYSEKNDYETLTSKYMEPTLQLVHPESFDPSPSAVPFNPQNTREKNRGTSIEIPWHYYSAKKTPPSNKWKSFNYVIEKMEILWASSQTENEEFLQEMSILKLFSTEKGCVADYLQLLRVLDKLSFCKNFILKLKNNDIYVYRIGNPNEKKILF